jgi:hypothetical protein
MTDFGRLDSNFRTKYGGWIDNTVPEINTLASKMPFSQKGKLGNKYSISFLVGIEQGVTYSRAAGLFPYREAIGAEAVDAELDGSTIVVRTQYSMDEVYASLDTNDPSALTNAGAYNDIMSLKMRAKGLSGSLRRDLALAYGPGSGSVASSNIGVVSTTAAGDLTTTRNLRLTRASWIRGLWPSLKNGLVDVYQSNGTTLRAANVQIYGVPAGNKTQITVGPSTVVGEATSNTAAVIAQNDIIVPAGSKGASAIGVEAMQLQQTGTLFGINLDQITQFRTNKETVGGAPTRKFIREMCARSKDNGCTTGGTLFVSGGAWTHVAEAFSTSFRDTSPGGEKLQGETEMGFDTPCGRVELVTWDLCKQGQMHFFANSCGMYRVGTTDNTMRPIKGLQEGFLAPLEGKSGMQSILYSNQAPFIECGWHNWIADGVVSDGDILDAA